MTVRSAGELVVVVLGCGTSYESVGGWTTVQCGKGGATVQGGKGDIDGASYAGGDSEVAGKYAVAAGIGDKSDVALDCTLSCSMPVPGEYDHFIFGRGGLGLG